MSDDLLRKTMLDLPMRAVPKDVSARLRVMGSHERERRINRFRRFQTWSLHFNNLFKPLAVPAFGGLLSSVLLFTALVHTLNVRRYLVNDTPLGVFTQVSVGDLSPFGGQGGDIMVVVTIDEQGRVADFSVPEGQVSQQQLRQIGNLLLYSTFTPATAYGQPVSGKILVALHHINVRG
jgi:hypothetical protein